MFDHVSIGVRDLARAKRFYDAVLASLGYACLSEDAGALGYGRDKIALWIGTAARPQYCRPRRRDKIIICRSNSPGCGKVRDFARQTRLTVRPARASPHRYKFSAALS